MRHHFTVRLGFVCTLVFSLTLILITLAFCATPNVQSTPASTAAPPVLNATDLAALRAELHQIARDEMVAGLDRAERGAIDTATEAMKHNDATMSYVSWFTTVSFGILTIIIGVGISIVLTGEYGLVKEARQNVKKANEEATAAKDEAVASSARVRQVETEAKATVERFKIAYDRAEAFDAAAEDALSEIHKYVESLPAVESPIIRGGRPEFPPSDEMMEMEEADLLVILGEKMIRPART